MPSTERQRTTLGKNLKGDMTFMIRPSAKEQAEFNKHKGKIRLLEGALKKTSKVIVNKKVIAELEAKEKARDKSKDKPVVEGKAKSIGDPSKLAEALGQRRKKS